MISIAYLQYVHNTLQIPVTSGEYGKVALF